MKNQRVVKYQVWHFDETRGDYTLDIGAYDCAEDALSHVNGYDAIIERYEVDDDFEIYNHKCVFASDGAYYRTLHKPFRNTIYRHLKTEEKGGGAMTIWEKKCLEACEKAGLDTRLAFDEDYVQYQPADDNYTGQTLTVDDYIKGQGHIAGHFRYRNKLFFVVRQF